jgi:hypothetical protein
MKVKEIGMILEMRYAFLLDSDDNDEKIIMHKDHPTMSSVLKKKETRLIMK